MFPVGGLGVYPACANSSETALFASSKDPTGKTQRQRRPRCESCQRTQQKTKYNGKQTCKKDHRLETAVPVHAIPYDAHTLQVITYDLLP
jgi:hypothetical protein